MVFFSAVLNHPVLTAEELVSPETIQNNKAKVGIIDQYQCRETET
jgi:hypothetical protein